MIGLFVWYLCPQRITVNTYLVLYFLHMSVLRRNPAIFNKTNRASFIASDYKCHLFAAAFGLIVGIIFISSKSSIFSLQFAYNVLPFISLVIADGYYGQYIVQKRIARRMQERKERERKKRLAENERVG